MSARTAARRDGLSGQAGSSVNGREIVRFPLARGNGVADQEFERCDLRWSAVTAHLNLSLYQALLLRNAAPSAAIVSPSIFIAAMA